MTGRIVVRSRQINVQSVHTYHSLRVGDISGDALLDEASES